MCEIYKNSCIWVHRTDVCQQPFSLRQKAEIHKQILNKTWRRWQAMTPHSIPLPCALTFPPPSHRDATTPSPCWAPHFMTQETHHVLESHPEQAAPLSHRDDERWHAIGSRHAVGSHSALAPRLHLAACSPSSSCRFWVLDHLCSNLSQSFHLCWVLEIRSLNLCVCFYLILFCLCFPDRIELQL